MLINKVVYRTERERVKQLNEMNGKYIILPIVATTIFIQNWTNETTFESMNCSRWMKDIKKDKKSLFYSSYFIKN